MSHVVTIIPQSLIPPHLGQLRASVLIVVYSKRDAFIYAYKNKSLGVSDNFMEMFIS